MEWDWQRGLWVKLTKAELKEERRMLQLLYLVQHAQKTHVGCTLEDCRLCETISEVSKIVKKWNQRMHTPPRE